MVDIIESFGMKIHCRLYIDGNSKLSMDHASTYCVLYGRLSLAVLSFDCPTNSFVTL